MIKIRLMRGKAPLGWESGELRDQDGAQGCSGLGDEAAVGGGLCDPAEQCWEHFMWEG